MSGLVIPSVDGYKGSRCVVTGGAGFIGSTLVRLLLRSGANVAVYDNLATGSLSNLDCRVDAGTSPEVVWGDVRDGERFSRMLRGGETVFHLACLGVRHSIHSPFENEDVNARGALTVLAACRRAGVHRFVHVSSSEVYGTARVVPMREDHPTHPHTVYGASKLAGECFARAYYRCYGFPAVVVRPFNSYGPFSHFEGDSGEVLPRFVLRALTGRPLMIFGDGTQTRDLTHVHDTAKAIALAGVAPGVEGMTFNAGSGREISVRQLADTICRVVGKPDLVIEHIEPRPGDVWRLLADSSAAERSLGFRPDVSPEKGIEGLVAWFRSTPWEKLEELVSKMGIRNWE